MVVDRWWRGLVLLLLATVAVAHEHKPQADPAAKREQAWAERLAVASPLAVGTTLDADGRLWLVRVENRRLLVSHSENGGRAFTLPVAATAEPEFIAADGENRPKIAVAPDGTVHLTWTQGLAKPMTGNIRYARSMDGGKTFTRPITLNDDVQEISHRFDSLAIDGHGKVAVVWLDGRDREAAKAKGRTFTGVSLFGAISGDNGATFGHNRKVAEHACECCRAGLTWTKDGPVAFWRHVFGLNTRDFAVSPLTGGSVRRVTDDDWEIDACPHHGGGIATDERGALHLTWFTQGKKRQGIFYRRIGAEGASVPLALGNPQAQAGHPTVAVHGRKVLLAWREFDGRAFSAWAQFSQDSGATWSSALRLAESAQAADYPMPLLDGRRALVVWNTAAEGLRVLTVEAAAK